MSPRILPLSIAVTALLTVTVAIYSLGLNGPFLFDDNVHISQNRWVKITALDWPSLWQAWNSSFADFPQSRPLSQLSFGVTHFFAGLHPWAYKTGNVVLHLLTGIAVYLFGRLVFVAAKGHETNNLDIVFGLTLAGLWLVHPLHVSTVLYIVQRMTQLSALFVILALTAYLYGRLRASQGRSGLGWMLATVPIAFVGLLGKENASLVPLYLLVMELTILRNTPLGTRPWRVRTVQLSFIVPPLLLAGLYLYLNPGLLNYDLRPFSLEERLLTQARVLWTYAHWIFVPDLTAMGLFHDGFKPSTGILTPQTTLPAVIGLLGVSALALLFRKRYPLLAFSVLFFLAGHALESSVFPLELVFEHRNYLPSIGLLMLMVTSLFAVYSTTGNHRLPIVIGLAFIVAFSAAATLRTINWSSYQKFLTASVTNHPESARANFSAAQYMIAAINHTEGPPTAVVATARELLENGLELNEDCLNCLFALIVLDLHLDREPDPDVVETLVERLRVNDFSATTISVGQFNFLVRWQAAGRSKMRNEDLERIFQAALTNPRLGAMSRSSVGASFSRYYETVTGDDHAALRYAKAARDAWSRPWSYHTTVIRLSIRLGHYDEAEDAIRLAQASARHKQQHLELDDFRQMIPDR